MQNNTLPGLICDVHQRQNFAHRRVVDGLAWLEGENIWLPGIFTMLIGGFMCQTTALLISYSRLIHINDTIKVFAQCELIFADSEFA